MKESETGDIIITRLTEQLCVGEIREIMCRADDVEESSDLFSCCLLNLSLRCGRVIVHVGFNDSAKTIIVTLVIEWRSLTTDWLAVSIVWFRLEDSLDLVLKNWWWWLFRNLLFCVSGFFRILLDWCGVLIDDGFRILKFHISLTWESRWSQSCSILNRNLLLWRWWRRWRRWWWRWWRWWSFSELWSLIVLSRWWWLIWIVDSNQGLLAISWWRYCWWQKWSSSYTWWCSWEWSESEWSESLELLRCQSWKSWKSTEHVTWWGSRAWSLWWAVEVDWSRALHSNRSIRTMAHRR